MPVSISIPQPLSQAERDAIIAEAVSQASASAGANDLGTLPNDPISATNGQFWYNSTEEAMKYKTPMGIATIDNVETLTTDAFGNPITIE